MRYSYTNSDEQFLPDEILYTIFLFCLRLKVRRNYSFWFLDLLVQTQHYEKEEDTQHASQKVQLPTLIHPWPRLASSLEAQGWHLWGTYNKQSEYGAINEYICIHGSLLPAFSWPTHDTYAIPRLSFSFPLLPFPACRQRSIRGDRQDRREVPNGHLSPVSWAPRRLFPLTTSDTGQYLSRSRI